MPVASVPSIKSYIHQRPVNRHLVKELLSE